MHVDDTQCFKEEVRKRVLSKDRFTGKVFDWNEVFKDAMQDMEPLNHTNFYSN